jgi:hypothetical protein
MAYLTQNYWVFGLSPSFSIPETKKHDVSENGSVFVLWFVGEDIYLVVSSD